MFRGANGIGMWAKIMTFLTIVGIAVNVLLVAYTSNSFRDSVIIPMWAGNDRCDGAALSGATSWYAVGNRCEGPNATSDAPCLSDEARALGLQIEWYANCPRNWRNCYAHIGGVEWLPARAYLSVNHSTTSPYVDKGLCDASSPLFNEAHCHLCKERMVSVDKGLLMFVLILEHALVIAVLAARSAFYDKPEWVQRAEAYENARMSSDHVSASVSSMRRQTSRSSACSA